jgi:hypothetical protein
VCVSQHFPTDAVPILDGVAAPTRYYRSARPEITEFHPAQPEEHFARARSLSSNMLPVPIYARLPFIPARMKPDLFTIGLDYGTKISDAKFVRWEGAATRIPEKIKSVGFVSGARLCHEHKMRATTNNFFFLCENRMA